jgi:hypothetical protein
VPLPPVQPSTTVPFYSAYPYVMDRPTVLVDPTGRCGVIPNPFESSSCLDQGVSTVAGVAGDVATWAWKYKGDIAGVAAGGACIVVSTGWCAAGIGTAGAVGEIDPVVYAVEGHVGTAVCESLPNLVVTGLGVGTAKAFGAAAGAATKAGHDLFSTNGLERAVNGSAAGPGFLWSVGHFFGDSCTASSPAPSTGGLGAAGK